MPKVEVFVEYPDGSTQAHSVSFGGPDPYWMNISGLRVGEERFEGTDLFMCLTKLRRALEGIESQILCNGARIDAYPSRMSRQMGSGVTLSLCEMGKPADSNNRLHIFDPAKRSEVGTVQQQEDHYRAWLKSI
jgi:hypothetical protein